MAMQKLVRKTSPTENEERIAFESTGDSVEGYYMGAETFTHGGSELTKHRVKGKDGTTFSFLGSYVLNTDLAQIPAGVYVQVTYEGKKKSKNGRTVKTFEIQFDADDRIAS